jgi:hypothetical protein
VVVIGLKGGPKGRLFLFHRAAIGYFLTRFYCIRQPYSDRVIARAVEGKNRHIHAEIADFHLSSQGNINFFCTQAFKLQIA